MTTTPGLLSIITATYNNADLLPRFFDSILTQEYSHWELIIVNDGSTDNTAEVCRSYLERDERIHYYEQSNQGQGVARNWALELMQGEYVAFLDADDAIKPSTYAAAIQKLEEHTACDIVSYPIEWINRQERFTTFREGEASIGYRNILNDLIVHKTLRLLITDKIYRSELLRGLHFVPRILFDDNLMMVQIAHRAKGICFSPEGGYEYHQEEYDPGKNDWTSHKEYSQIFVNCRYIDELSKDKSIRNCRAMIYQQIGNQLNSYIKAKRLEEELARELIRYIKTMPLSDALYNCVLSLKHKVKLLLLKVYSQL